MASALEKLRKARQGSGTSLASANIGGSSGGLSSGSGGSSALAKLRAARAGQAKEQKAQSTLGGNLSGGSGTSLGTEKKEEKNRGDLLGGLGYTLEKVGLSAVQSVEGIFDSVIGGVSDLFGADKFAERQFANDWLNYNHADEWYDATGGWKLAGDLGSAVGSSIPTTAAALVATIFTSGAALPMLVSGVVGGLSAMGSAVKEAYQETGELSGEEWGYGVRTGATEGLMEAAMGKLGAGASAIGSRIGKAFGKSAAKEVGKTTLKSVAKDIGKDFLSEAFEEGMSEFLSPYYKRATYDPSAKNATAGEIGYAALVGGLSGVLMSGAGTTVTQALNVRRGSQIESKGGADKVMVISETILNAEGATKTKVRSVNAVRELYHDLTEGKLKITEGQSLSVAQKRALGELQVANMSALFQPKMVQSARNVLENSESIAERLNSYGTLKMVDGKFTVVDNIESFTEKNPKAEIRDITAEDIRRGFKKDSDNALVKALEENDVLRYVVASDVAGRLIMSVDQFEKSARAGTKIQSQVDLNNFIERATPEQKHALGAEIGIADNEWATLKLNRFNEAAAAYRESGKLDAKRAEIQARKEKASAVTQTPSDVAKTLKTAENTALTNTDQGNVSVSGGISPSARMSVDEITDNPSVAGGDTSLYTKEAKAKDPSAVRVSELKDRLDAKKIDSYAAENIEGYSSLGEANKSMIRQVVREGRATGISDEDTLRYARVAAKTGVNVEFDSSMKEGEAGYFDPKNNRIVVNPKSEKKGSMILIHELDHALRSYLGDDGKIHYVSYANRGLSEETKAKIREAYADQEIDVDRAELIADEESAYYTEALLGTDKFIDLLLGKEPTLREKILDFFRGAIKSYSKDAELAKAARKHYRSFKKMFDAFAERNQGRNAMTAEEARGKISDSRFSLEFAPKIAENQREFLAKDSRIRKIKKQEVTLTESELENAIAQTAEMVEAMSDKKGILPKDKVDKTLVKNGSYDISVENTTICLRTLSYNSFVDMVSEKIGRPLSQMESFLVSQKLYDIAKEPQCLYCYVSLDRKAYNDMLLRYIEQRDAAIKAYVDAGKPRLTKDSTLYKDFLDGRKPTDNMWDRYNGWIKAYNDGVHILTAEDIATEAKRSNLFNSKDTSQSSQVKDMLKYAQSASWAKKQTDYVAYYDDILKLSDKVIKELNKHYGLRWYSFSDYSGAFIVENMQQITDAAIRGLKGLAYTKDTDFAKIFAPTGMNINISVYVTKDGKGGYVVDEKQSANIKEAIALREQYPNVGIVAVATDQQGVEWALNQEWSDVVIPFHTVRTGAQVAEFYDWTVFNEEQNDTIKDENLWDTYTESVTNGNEKAKKKVSKMVYPSEHQNNKETYLRIIEERGLKPRFSSFLDNPNYMKLVNETRQSESQTKPLKPDFALDAAKESFGKFVEKGGYYEGWYNDGIDVDAEADIVAQDIREGKKANEVDYGRQDRNGNATPTPEELMASRKKSRSHGATVDKSVRKSKEITPEINSAYLDAVNRGDMKTAQRMVDEAAKEAGYAYKGYHGTKRGGFTVFKNRMPGVIEGIKSIFLAKDDGTAAQYAYGANKKIYSLYAKMESPLIVNCGYSAADNISTGNKPEIRELANKYLRDAWERANPNDNLTTDQIGYLALRSGIYDGVIFKNVNDSYTYRNITDVYEVFEPEQVKSADPVTYDDDGNVIPLSERFNPKNKDIRYSMDITPEIEAEFVSPTEGNVGLSRFEKADIKLGDKIKDTFTTTADKLYIDTVDELYGVEKYLKTRGKMKDANAFTQSVRAAETMAQTMIGVAQYDITDPSGKKLGDGLTKIFKKYKLRKIDGKFNDYLLHQLNVDRMTLEERSLAKQEELRKAFETAEAAYHRAKRLVDDGKRKTVPKDIWNAYRKAKSEYENYEVLKNKPVFGENETRAKDITAEESRKIIAEFEKRYPEFKESAEAVWAYSRNLQAMRVAAGLLSQESADIMAEYYPHYVPSFRDKNGSVGAGTVKNDSQLAVNSTVKSAKGGGEDIFDVEESMAIQTRQTIKAIKMNQLANAVYDAAVASGDTKYVLTAEAAERIENAGDDADIDIDIELTPKNNQIVFYRDGKKVAMNVSEEIFKGFKGVTEGSVPDFALARLSSKVLGGFKNLVTQYSPAFAARNFIRDMQDAMINTKHPKGFATHIKDALMGMANNNERWQLYLAYGGFASTVFDAKGFQNAVGSRGFEELKKLSGISAKDFKSMSIPLKNLFTTVGNINSIIEQLTRFTEFNASLDAGDSIEVAINNSAEVTTNFSRHGTMVKKLNATVIPFLNASVQGFDKMLRVISGPFKEKSLTALAILLAKIVAIGITPQILNMIMNGDDEDYNDLTDEVKSNYFLIKVGDQFIKIPRGRLAGAFGGFVNQMRNVSRGEGFDAEGYAESIVTNLTPVDSFSRDIFSPFRDVASNTTWYGGEVEGRQFEGIRPGQRYDESTSSIAIALGKAFNYSPKKIHYLLDQYSGVIGDFLLPATTKKAEKDYFSGNFLLDPKTNNKLSDQFYKLYDEAQYAKNEGNVTAYYQLKHLNDVKESVSELYDEITRIQNSDLANAEKLQQVRTIRTLINNLYKTAKADYGAYTQAIEATEGMFDESDASQQRLRHTVITQMMYGSEKALEVYNKSVYDKAVLFNKAGLDYDTYYEYYFTTRGIESDVDRHGEVVAGSKKKKTLAAIKALGVGQNERLLLTAAAGYALSDGEKRRLLSHIMRLGVSKEEKAAIAEACGFKVKNGRISMK